MGSCVWGVVPIVVWWVGWDACCVGNESSLFVGCLGRGGLGVSEI